MLIRNLLFYLGIIPATVFFALLAMVSFALPYATRYYLITRWSHFFIFWAKCTCHLKYHVSGTENIPIKNAIILSNHQSMWETIFMQVLFPTQTWILKKELLSIPCFGWGLALLEPIAINRQDLHSITQLIQQGKEKLQLGRWVVIFPEGTRVAPSVVKRYTKSGAALSNATQYPILPIAHNAGLFWPKGFFIKKPGTIQVNIGQLIEPAGKTIAEIHETAEQWIRTHSQALLETSK